jgi:hypothetical protein
MNSFNKTNISDPFINQNKITPYSPGELNGLFFAAKDNIDIRFLTVQGIWGLC